MKECCIESDVTLLVFIVGVVIGIFIGGFFGYLSGFNRANEWAVEKGHAQHHPVTGNFEWKEIK
jgi:hypothetical protein